MTHSSLVETQPVSVKPLDGAGVLTIYLLLLVCIPSRLVVSGVGGAGTLANFAAVGCALWWLWEMVRRADPIGLRSNPVRTTAALFLLAVGVSYWVATTRPINAPELTSADTGMLFVIAWMGVLLVGHDGIPTLERLRTLLKRMVAAGGALAVLGLTQFFTGMPLTDLISIPGMVTNLPLDSLSSREGFNRPASTALHAIEFSVVITMLLPLALTLARQKDGRNPIRRWFPVIAIVAAVPITISRSAMVGAIVGLAVLIPSLPKEFRRLMLVGCAFLGCAVFVLVPGMLGSLIGLFTGVSTDSSALSRTGSYDIVWEYFLRNPVFGRGFFTFQPAYRILDNQYLGLLLDVGLFGLMMVLALLVSGMLVAFRAKKRSTDSAYGELGQAIAAAIAVGAVGMALFDGFGFPMAAGFLFLLLGVAGALWRLVRAESSAEVSPTEVPSS